MKPHEQQAWELAPESGLGLEYSERGMQQMVYALECTINRLLKEGADGFGISWDVDRKIAIVKARRPVNEYQCQEPHPSPQRI